MTVKELIEKLQTFPQDMQIIFDGPDCGGYDVCYNYDVEIVRSDEETDETRGDWARDMLNVTTPCLRFGGVHEVEYKPYEHVLTNVLDLAKEKFGNGS